MAEPLRVAVRRGEILESVHRVHAVAVQDGKVVASAGDPDLLASLRSSAKPIQALLLARAREDLDQNDLAIASASHFGTEMHVEAVRTLLRKTRGAESELDCGLQDGRPPEPIYHNCSGKHAAMIAVCRAHGWQVDGYRLPDHPLQEALHAEVAAVAELDASDVATGLDGCGVVCFGVPLERAARAFSRLPETRVAGAMVARPELIGGTGSTDTELMRMNPGWIAKGGAEGLMCVGNPDGLGLAVKVADGNSRALRPALAQFGAALGLDVSGFAEQTIQNSHGEPAGATASF